MKKYKILISFIIIIWVLLASCYTVSAIDFDAETVYESVFVIYSGNSMGSGFAIGENCIVTNAHVIENEHKITIESYGGTEYRTSLLGMNKEKDIAILMVENESFTALEVANVSEMKIGDDIYTIGAPKGMTYTLTKGSISAKDRTFGFNSYIQIDAPINEGNSGGPLLNSEGKVLGVNTLKMTDSEGIGLAIPITEVCSYIDSLGIETAENGNVSGSVTLQQETTPESNETDPENENETSDEVENNTYTEEEKPSTLNVTIIAVLIISLAVNLILTILLVYEKKKNVAVGYDPRERTDFDIDIWE